MPDFRSINREDVSAVTEFALRALRSVADEQPLHVAPLKVKDAVAFFARQQPGQHFNLAAFEEKVCVGAIAAYAAEMAYFERQECHVMFGYATLPGVGMKLIRELVGWVRSEPRIRRIVWAMNDGTMGERMARVINRRLGFRPVTLLVWAKE